MMNEQAVFMTDWMSEVAFWSLVVVAILSLALVAGAVIYWLAALGNDVHDRIVERRARRQSDRHQGVDRLTHAPA